MMLLARSRISQNQKSHVLIGKKRHQAIINLKTFLSFGRNFLVNRQYFQR